MSSVKPRKRYESPRRREQLDATRTRILESARELFRQRGYPGTTIDSIARASGLAVPTVYKNFGNKRRLLLALIDRTIDRRVQPELDAVLAQPVPRDRLAALAAMCVHLASGASDVVSTLVSAAGADPRFARMLDQTAEGRRASAALVASSLAREGALHPGVSEEQARDVMYALAGPETYDLLVGRSGWHDEQFETWLSETLAATLLGERWRGVRVADQ